MRKPGVGDAQQSSPGDLIALLVGGYDPPSMDYVRAMDALFQRQGISGVWTCPLFPGTTEAGSDKRVREMTMILCADYAASTRRQPTCCTVALDETVTSESELLRWARVCYPFLRFVVATMNPSSDCDGPIIVKFAMQDPATKPGATVLFLHDFLPVGHGMRDRIAQGSDESRNLTPGVWSYVQQNGLYR